MSRPGLGSAALLPLFALGLTVACSPQDDQAPGNEADLSAPIIGNEQDLPDNGDAANNAAQAVAPPDGTVDEQEDTDLIPLAMRGRWGLVDADCTSRHGDAKGLLEISETALTFYESRATLADFTEWAPDHIRAEFNFSGEGMNWQRDMALALKDDGKTLIRREYGADAAPAPFSYRRCGG